MLFHDSFDAFYRDPSGPAPAGSRITIRFRSDEARNVQLVTWRLKEEPVRSKMTRSGADLDVWSADFNVPEQPGLLWYSFEVTLPDGSVKRYGNAYDRLGGEGAVYEIGDVAGFQLTIYDPAYRTPGFMHGANIYQIFPDRFCKAETAAVDDRTDRDMHETWDEDLLDRLPEYPVFHATNFYGGNLNGIAEKLPYLHALGVTVLYLNPIFKSHSNHRYDTGDYTQVDPLLGTNAEFGQLCEKAEAMGIRVILDGVFSHTGEDSIYFNALGTYDSIGAAQSKDSLYYDWYFFDHYPHQYRCWWGVPSLPELDETNPRYQEFILNERNGIVPRWIRAGASGWRLDVADELPMPFLRRLRTAAKRARRDAVVLGEVWEDASDKVAYGETRCYCAGDTLDSVMNYPLRTAILDFVTGKSSAPDLVRLVKHQADVYPAPFRYALMNLIGSHDRARVLNILAGKEGAQLSLAQRKDVKLDPAEYAQAVEKYKLCVELLCALPGCPTIYYGDEAGLTGCPDPFCRRTFPWGREDRDLTAFVSEKLNQRKDSPVLKYGFCDIAALDDDTVEIRRYFNGRDALGRKAAGKEAVFTLRR